LQQQEEGLDREEQDQQQEDVGLHQQDFAEEMVAADMSLKESDSSFRNTGGQHQLKQWEGSGELAMDVLASAAAAAAQDADEGVPTIGGPREGGERGRRQVEQTAEAGESHILG
jgi:hypothetical protein